MLHAIAMPPLSKISRVCTIVAAIDQKKNRHHIEVERQKKMIRFIHAGV